MRRKPKHYTDNIDVKAAERFISGVSSAATTLVPAKTKKKLVARHFDSDLLAAINALAARRGISRNTIGSYWCSKGVENE